jgi:hypothetical protein
MVNDHETKKKLILAGMGWGRLQNHLISDELAGYEQFGAMLFCREQQHHGAGLPFFHRDQRAGIECHAEHAV